MYMYSQGEGDTYTYLSSRYKYSCNAYWFVILHKYLARRTKQIILNGSPKSHNLDSTHAANATQIGLGREST